MTTTDTSPADILDFRLLDEAGHPALNIEKEGRTNLLRLEIENVSANMLTFPPAAQDRASKGEHHFSVSFRPGSLSNQTLARLTETDPPMDILDRATGWDLRVERARQPIDPVTLYFLYTASRNTPRLAAAGGGEAAADDGKTSILRLELHNIAASPGDGVRPSAAQLGIDKMYVGSRLDNWFRLQRRAELYITHAGGRPSGGRLAGPPLRLDLLDDVAIASGPPSTSTAVHLMLSNPSADTPIEGDHVELVMDIGEEDRWWALAAKGEFDTADYASLSAKPVGGHTPLAGPMEPIGNQQSPNALHWKVNLPNSRLLPGQGIDLLMSLKTNRAMPLAIHIDSDLIGFGANRQTFLFPRSRFTLRQFNADVRKIHEKLSITDAKLGPLPDKMDLAEQSLLKHNERITKLEEEMHWLKSQVTATTALCHILEAHAHIEAISEGIPTIPPGHPVRAHLKLDIHEGHWAIKVSFTGTIGPAAHSPADKPRAIWFTGIDHAGRLLLPEFFFFFLYEFIFNEQIHLLLEFVPNNGRLYYHGRLVDSLQPLGSYAPKPSRDPMEDRMNVDYSKRREKFLKEKVTPFPLVEVDLAKLLGPF